MKVYSVIALALAAVATFAQVDPAKTVLTINGENVNGAEYYRRMEFLPDVGRVLEGGHVAVYPPGFLTIVQLINEHLVLQLAKQKGLIPTDQEIDNTLSETEAADPNFKSSWINSGRTEPELRDQVRFQLIQFKLTTEGITVSDQEVADFYHSSSIPGLTTVPRSVKMSLIAVRDDTGMKKVDSDLAAGKSFSAVAHDESADATSANGGELGTVAIDNLPKEVANAVDHTHQGEVTGWVSVPVGTSSDGTTPLMVHVKYSIESKEAEKHFDFNDALKSRLRRYLMLNKGKIKNDVEVELSALRKTSKIAITSPEFAKMYEQFMKEFFRESVTTSGGSGS
ncbi:MAG TPA: peptidylprolyl isomerase [Fimbriimonadaceae bacterium]